MTKSPIAGIARGACAAALIAASGSAASAAPPEAGTTAAPARLTIPADLRNVCYCEVITVVRKRLTLHVDVYNTLGLNFCPADKWSALNAKALAKQLKVSFVKLNGPRYWMIDSIEAKGATASGKIADFGGIGMVLRATLTTKLWQGTVAFDQEEVRHHLPARTTTAPAGRAKQSADSIANCALVIAEPDPAINEA